jgi:DNA-binding transcriptional LysR family regulator
MHGVATMRMDFTSLKMFVAVCDHKSISRAAEKENIAPSAMSKRISLLEETLRVPLFTRSHKGLELTPAGHTLLQHARIVLRDLDQLDSELIDHAKGVHGLIRMHASVSTIVQYLPNDIRDFLALHPGIRIELEEGLSQQVARAVSENVADIGVFGDHAPISGLHVRPYRTDRLVVLMPDDHPLRAERGLTFAAIAEFDVVGPQKGSYLDALMLRAAADLGRPLRMRVRVHGFEPARSMVEAKLGIALVPEHHAARYVVNAPLVAVRLDEDWALRRWNICVRDVPSLPPPVELLLQHLSPRGEQTDAGAARRRKVARGRK